MKILLNFEEVETKKLLAKLDFEFYLKQNIEDQKYDESEIAKIHSFYKLTVENIKEKAKTNKKQFNLYSEGQVRKMFTGGLLPALFQLDETRELTIFNFEEVGENWAYFACWQKYYRKKITCERIWTVTIRVGSILGILLSLFKFFELMK